MSLAMLNPESVFAEASSDNLLPTVDSFRASTYTRVLAEWQKKYSAIKDEDYTLTPGELKALNPSLTLASDENYSDEVFVLKKNDTLIVKVEVANEGLYNLALDYAYQTDFTKNPKIALSVNDEVLFNEMTNINLEVYWKQVEREESKRYNQYGDELLPLSEAIKTWQKAFLKDEISGHQEPYFILLKEGSNEIKIVSLSDDLFVGNVYLTCQDELPSYQEYSAGYPQAIVDNQTSVKIEAEEYLTKNNIEVKSSYFKGVAISPSAYKTKVLNILDGNSTSRGGTVVTYQFPIEERGFYQLSLKIKQNTLADLSVARNIYIDGSIPFKELKGYLFPSTKKWVNHTLGGDEPYLIYLDKGIHTLALETVTYHITDIIDRLYYCMDEINRLGLTIKSITGNSQNTQIDWNIEKYLPSLKGDLLALAQIVSECYQRVNDLDPESKQASEVSTLKIASKQLERLAKHPNKVQNRLGELCDGSGSAYQLIGTAIGTLALQPLDIDFMVFHGEGYKLPKPNGNFFARLWFGLKSFIYSFFDQRTKIISKTDDESLEIWVAQSALYTNILQDIIDSEFTPKSNIKVKLHILPSSQKLVLNNATKTNPDLVLGIDSWEPYTFALRGMLEDLSKYPDFDSVTSQIVANNFTPLIYDTGVYGIPETQGMQLLFYRKDIFDFLGLNPPDTWEDVIKILPTLQSFSMNFYHPLGNDSAYKGYSLTSPFFYLMGAEMYDDTGYLSNLDTLEVIEAIEFMTKLFTIYNLPQQVAIFFEHFRSGTLPAGLASIDFYLQLKYACPELTGQWKVLPIPGMYSEELQEVARWTTTYGKCSIMFKDSDKKSEGWEFLKWFHSTEIQSLYLNQVKMILGEKYLFVPANMQSLADSPWDEEIKTQIVAQAKWSRIPAIIPGSYVVEREISNIWNKVVIDKMNVRVAINQSIPKINRELKRKFEEFGYLKDGQPVKQYLVPKLDNLDRWVKGYRYEEK